MGDEGLLVYLLLSAGVILLAYMAMRYLTVWQTGRMRGRKMQVLEAMPIGRDRQLLLVAVGGEVLLLGTSPAGTQLLHRVESPGAVSDLLADPEPTAGERTLAAPELFAQILTRLRPTAIPGARAQAGSAESAIDESEAAIQASLDRLRGAVRRQQNGGNPGA